MTSTNHHKKLLIGGAAGLLVAGAAVALLNQKPSEEEVRTEVDKWTTDLNTRLRQETGAIALETHSLTPVSSGEYKLVTRATLNSLGQADESKDCVDLATTISIHSALSSTPVTTHTSVISDPAQSDCQWLSSLTGEDRQLFDEVLKGRIPVTLDAEFARSGASQWHLKSEEIKHTQITEQGEVLIQITPFLMDVSVPETGDQYQYSLSNQGMEFGVKNPQTQEDITRVAFGPVTSSAKGQKVTENLWTGAMTLKMENVALNAENKFFTLTSVDVTSDVHKEDAYLNSSVALTFNGVRTKNGQSPQKEIDLGMLNYRFEANKLEIASLDKLSQLFVELESHPDQYGAMIKEVTQLFSKAADNSELKASLDHQINNNGLKVELNARPLGLSKITEEHLQHPSVLLSFLQASFACSLDEEYLKHFENGPTMSAADREKMRKTIDSLVQAAALVKEGSTYKTTVEWSGDSMMLLVNGVPPTPDMMRLLGPK